MAACIRNRTRRVPGYGGKLLWENRAWVSLGVTWEISAQFPVRSFTSVERSSYAVEPSSDRDTREIAPIAPRA